MNNMLFMLEKIIPEGITQFEVRYTILQHIMVHQPIGRRTLATQTTYSERTIRSAIEILAKQGLIDTTYSGMILTEDGKKVIETLYPMREVMQQLSGLEEAMARVFEARKVIVIPGNVDEDQSVKWQLGRAGAGLIAKLIKDNYTLSITGGSTIAKMVEAIPDKSITKNNITVIPARGSIGKKMEFQANTLAVAFAKKIGATYEVLNIPDNLSQEAVETIKKEPHMQKTLQKMAKSDMMVMGLGEALKMAKRRHEDEETLALLQNKGAIAEAFRYYFDKEGQVIYSTTNIGIDLEIAKSIPNRIVLAGGASKAPALMATKMLLKDSYLIVDEGAATAILNQTKH